MLNSPYADGVPVPTPGGGWLLSYHQDNADPAARDTMFTYRGLMQCLADQVPVAYCARWHLPTTAAGMTSSRPGHACAVVRRAHLHRSGRRNTILGAGEAP
jgi:hypothetical protein